MGIVLESITIEAGLVLTTLCMHPAWPSNAVPTADTWQINYILPKVPETNQFFGICQLLQF